MLIDQYYECPMCLLAEIREEAEIRAAQEAAFEAQEARAASWDGRTY